MAFPFLIMVGNDTPTGPFHLKELQRVSMTSEMASGRAGFGVGMRKRSLTNVPFTVSTIAPLIPEPPTSIPSISIIY
jgi:hypothetical protein